MKRFFLNPGVLISLVLYVASFAILTRNPNFQPVEALFELAIFGIILPLIAWFATRRARPLSIAVRRDDREMILMLVLLVALAIYLIGGPQGIDYLLPRSWIDSPRIHFLITLGKKLLAFVLIPYSAFRIFFGYKWRDFGLQPAGLRELAGSHGLAVLLLSIAFLVFQFFLGGATAPLREGKLSAAQLLIGLPLCFIWLAAEAGLVEEFFFRALVQSRLAVWFRSEITAVPLMALVFGLAHAPGFIFRHGAAVEGIGANPSAVDALAYAVVVLAPAAIIFGIVWARTKNLFALIIIHAAGDLLPNLMEFVQRWGIGLTS